MLNSLKVAYATRDTEKFYFMPKGSSSIYDYRWEADFLKAINSYDIVFHYGENIRGATTYNIEFDTDRKGLEYYAKKLGITPRVKVKRNILTIQKIVALRESFYNARLYLTGKYLTKNLREYYNVSTPQLVESIASIYNPINKTLPPMKLKSFNGLASENLKRIIDGEIGDFTLDFQGVDMNYSKGGLHGARPYTALVSIDRHIYSIDLFSAYPSIALLTGIISRSIPNSQAFLEMYEARRDKDTNIDLCAVKTFLNTATGLLGQRSSRLYAPDQALRMRCLCQLMLTDLMNFLKSDLSGCVVHYANTDGIVIETADEIKLVEASIKEWSDETNLMADITELQKCFIKDTNNILYIDFNGNIKAKGAAFKFEENFNSPKFTMNLQDAEDSYNLVLTLEFGVENTFPLSKTRQDISDKFFDNYKERNKNFLEGVKE